MFKNDVSQKQKISKAWILQILAAVTKQMINYVSQQPKKKQLENDISKMISQIIDNFLDPKENFLSYIQIVASITS